MRSRKAPLQPAPADLMLRAAEVQRRRVKYTYLLLRDRWRRGCRSYRRRLQPLIAIGTHRLRISIRLMHSIHERKNIARHSQAEVLRKGLTIGKRTQVFRIRDYPRLRGKVMPA